MQIPISGLKCDLVFPEPSTKASLLKHEIWNLHIARPVRLCHLVRLLISSSAGRAQTGVFSSHRSLAQQFIDCDFQYLQKNELSRLSISPPMSAQIQLSSGTATKFSLVPAGTSRRQHMRTRLRWKPLLTTVTDRMSGFSRSQSENARISLKVPNRLNAILACRRSPGSDGHKVVPSPRLCR